MRVGVERGALGELSWIFIQMILRMFNDLKSGLNFTEQVFFHFVLVFFR